MSNKLNLEKLIEDYDRYNRGLLGYEIRDSWYAELISALGHYSIDLDKEHFCDSPFIDKMVYDSPSGAVVYKFYSYVMHGDYDTELKSIVIDFLKDEVSSDAFLMKTYACLFIRMAVKLLTPEELAYAIWPVFSCDEVSSFRLLHCLEYDMTLFHEVDGKLRPAGKDYFRVVVSRDFILRNLSNFGSLWSVITSRIFGSNDLRIPLYLVQYILKLKNRIQYFVDASNDICWEFDGKLFGVKNPLEIEIGIPNPNHIEFEFDIIIEHDESYRWLIPIQRKKIMKIFWTVFNLARENVKSLLYRIGSRNDISFIVKGSMVDSLIVTESRTFAELLCMASVDETAFKYKIYDNDDFYTSRFMDDIIVSYNKDSDTLDVTGGKLDNWSDLVDMEDWLGDDKDFNIKDLDNVVGIVTSCYNMQ